MVEQDRGKTGNSSRKIGQYTLLHTLGEGGSAKVFLGKHIYLDTLAAIKILHNPLNPKQAKRFLHEAKIIARFSHPHIVVGWDYDVEGGKSFLIMYYAPNGSLRQLVPAGNMLPLDTVVVYSKQIAKALQYAHNRGVIHRDVKPENILIGPNNELLLSDFGIALDIYDEDELAVPNAAGTVIYAAPEQLNGASHEASDQYALASVVYELLAGTPPFTGTKLEIVYRKMHETPPFLCEVAPHVPLAVGMVVMRALSKDPWKRFSSVSAFATALENASRQVPRVSSKSSTRQRSHQMSNHFFSRIAAFFLGVMLLGSMAGIANLLG